MKLKRPNRTVFIISLVLVLLAFLVFFGIVSILVTPFWIMVVAFGVLVLAMLV
jgi:hypothetical protein